MGIYSYKELERKIKAEGQLTEEEAEEVNTQLAQQAISGKKTAIIRTNGALTHNVKGVVYHELISKGYKVENLSSGLQVRLDFNL